MAKFKVGDKVKIIQRKKNNSSGTEPGWNEPNGNVGEIGYVKIISENYRICRTKDEKGYFGWFDEDDLELVSEEVSTTPYVKGKWYGCKHWKDKHDYVKLDYIYSDKTRIYFTECIDDTEYRQINDWWGIEKKELFEADMSIVSQFLPEGHPDKIGSEEFVLPEKWCIKLTEENVDVLGKWRSSGPLKDPKYAKEGWYLHTPKHGANGYNEPSKDPDYTEITFEQFKQHVLKESPVVEIPKEIDMQAIQEEAKKRFPIGCKFIPVGDIITYTLIEDDCTYTIHNNYIWASDSHGSLYENGKWAELVSLPKKEESIPEYVECVKQYFGGKGASVLNKIYKTSETSDFSVFNWKEVLSGYTKSYFKPSTKEAYEAQFVSKELTIEEWEPGTYAVGVKGNFGIYEGFKNLIPIGHIYTIKENKTVEVILEGENFWVYKENLKWFATYQEALAFSRELNSEYIKINSSEKAEPNYQLWVGDPIVEERINTPSIKKETFIENVQSVNVMLRTKRKSIKF